MTGGTPEARDFNRGVARVAGALGLGFGLGSQRAMLEDPALAFTYAVRDVAPDVLLFGNLGAAQVARTPIDAVRDLLGRVGADALCVHLNAAQERIQPEGDRDFRGVLDAIGVLVRDLGRPVVVKEVGAGIARETALRLREAGVRTVDVAGVGGTSWTRLESERAGRGDDPEARALWDWGIPTAAAVWEASSTGIEVLGSGGVRTGLDAARAIALGAVAAGVAAPVACAWFRGGEAEVERFLRGMVRGIATAMLLSGCCRVPDLRRAPRVVSGPLSDWMARR
jgi:isopentenyl-diphosphate delta-isomerase